MSSDKLEPAARALVHSVVEYLIQTHTASAASLEWVLLSPSLSVLLWLVSFSVSEVEDIVSSCLFSFNYFTSKTITAQLSTHAGIQAPFHFKAPIVQE